MRFRLNPSAVEVGQSRIGDTLSVAARRAGMPGPNMKAQIVGSVLGALAGETQVTRTWNAEYDSYLAMGQEIRDVLTRARQEIRNETAEQNAPKKAVICPYCGATTIPDAAGRCEYCGGPVGA
jgi:hypothetical protein